MEYLFSYLDNFLACMIPTDNKKNRGYESAGTTHSRHQVHLIVETDGAMVRGKDTSFD